jgi:pimeloyl-ACP methyl ester carboxylesterase
MRKHLALFGFFLFFAGGTALVFAAPIKPNLRPVLPVSQDGFVGVVWDLPPHQPPLEWIAQASLTEDFTRIASSSGWIRPEIGSFFLTVPPGDVWVRVGARERGRREVIWSEVKHSYQRDRFGVNWFGRPNWPSAREPEKVPRPVIFIHGFGGRPGDWQRRGYLDLLLKNGYDSDLLQTYAYADYDFDGAYDAGGEIRGVSRDLPALISSLRRLHRARGGDGKVDLVMFSLGGLLGRTYLRSVLREPGVGKFVDVASPHRGVRWLRGWEGLGVGPEGPALQKALATLVREFYERRGERPLDLEAPAVRELAPGSDFLDWVNAEAPSREVDYHLLYGDIKVRFSQRLFHLDLKSKEYSLGDLLIDPASATTIPGVNPHLHAFTSNHQVRIRPVRGQGGWLYRLDLQLPNLRYWHSQLIRQKEVKMKVLEILRDG